MNNKTGLLTGGLCVALLSGCNSDPQVLIGYSANQLCSRHFISDEPVDFIKSRVIPEALATLPDDTQIHVDSGNHVVTLSAAIDNEIITRTSVYREGFGCTLLFDLTKEQLRAQTAHVNTPEASPSAPIDKAVNSNLTLDKFFKTNQYDYAWSDNTFAVAVMHKGKLVAEQYDDHHHGDTRVLSWSMAKTLTALMTGVLIDQGKLALNQTVSFGQHGMTIKNLLNMSSGVKWAETPDIHGYEDLAPMWYYHGNSVEYVSALGKEYTPGSRFEYATGTTQLLSSAIKTASGGSFQTVNDLYQSHLFKPLGINNAVVEFDEAGNFRGGARMFLTIHDWLKIGELFINQGRWGDQQVVPESWLTEVMMSPGVSKHYGAQLWLNDLQFWLPKLPKDTVSLRGHRGQYVIIIPSKQLVVARFGAYGSVVNQNIGLANKRVFSAVVDVLKQLEK
ncbi:serine hydrolase [Pseudoalteromonas sp. MMG005]|uniref:serine hydrolase domain-containing protein n=1 Tax=Pseudoalteromonas sp. MMG005 TaxID=2822682 RepID=UPI001B39EE24|nr:serine hydrolase [Pseudoalteromonas sp. MMG005]MBQ4848274.1 serine hydrolase [Pseudoalteromonas sp. MMG005]